MPSKFLVLFLPSWSLEFIQRVTLPWPQAQHALQPLKHTPKQSGLQQRHRAALLSPHHLANGLCWTTQRQPWAVLSLGKRFPEVSCSATPAKARSFFSSLQGQPLPNECQPHILRRHSMCLPELGSPLHCSNNPALGREILSTVSYPSPPVEKFY